MNDKRERIMNLYVSRYLNLYTSHRNTTILFSGISGAIDEVELELGNKLKKIQLSRRAVNDETLSLLKASEVSFLVRRGHLTDKDPDVEHEFFCRYVAKMDLLLNEQRQERGLLMIVPSYGCNLRCPYCFQSDLHNNEGGLNADHLTPERVDDIFNKAIPRLFPKVKCLNKISICLYGGEPFLLKNQDALDAIFGYTIKNQMPVAAVSNGTEVHNYFQYFGAMPGYVNNVQISLDGGMQEHNKSRVFSDGGGSFDQIIENVHSLVDKKVTVNIRINASRQNLCTIDGLINYLDREELLNHPKVHVYTWAINYSDSKLGLTNWKLAKHVEALSASVESPIGRRQRRLRSVINAEEGLVLRRTAHCMRNVPSFFLIDLFGDIYGCYEEAGHPERRIGHFSDTGHLEMSENYKANMARHVGLCEPCSRCSLALTCGGGCAVAAMSHHGSQYYGNCDSHKECMAEAVKRLFKERVENIEIQSNSEDCFDLLPNA